MKKSQTIEAEQCSDDECDCHVYNKYVDVILKYTPFGIGWKIARYQSNIRWWLKCRYQKFKYGVSDDDVYDLDYKIAEFVVPRLIYFRNREKFGIPNQFLPSNYGILSEEQREEAEQKGMAEWNKTLDEIIFAFDYTINDEKYLTMPDFSQFYDSTNDFLKAISNNREKSDGEKQLYKEYIEKARELSARQSKGFELFTKHHSDLWI